MNNRFFLVFFLFLLLCTGCEKQNNNVVGLGYWNLPAYGKPVEEMQDFIKLIDSCDKNPQSCNRLKKIIDENRITFNWWHVEQAKAIKETYVALAELCAAVSSRINCVGLRNTFSVNSLKSSHLLRCNVCSH